MAQQLRALQHWDSQLYSNPRDPTPLMTSTGTACAWFTGRQAGQTLIHIKENKITTDYFELYM